MDEKSSRFDNIIRDHDSEGLIALSDSEKEDFLITLIYDHLSEKPFAEMNEVQRTLFLASRLEDVCQADSLPSLSEDEEIFLALPEIKTAYEKLGAVKTAELLGEFIELVPDGTVPEWDWFFEPERNDTINRLDSAICDYPDGVMRNFYTAYISKPQNAELLLDGLQALGHEEWDNGDFVVPKEFLLDKGSSLADALNVFYKAGGYDFFKVVDPEKYASNWLEFIGGLYEDIEDGVYKPDGGRFVFPLSEQERASLIEQGVPEIFTSDF